MALGQEPQENHQRSNNSSRRRTTCSICGLEGHKANNRNFHPQGNPNARVGHSMPSIRNSLQRTHRNVGEIDDELPAQQLHNDSEDEDTDTDHFNDDEFGTDMLFWEDDPHSHDPVDEGQFEPWRQDLPPFKGPAPGPNLAGLRDIDAKDLRIPFSRFFTPEMFDKMLHATNSFGRLYVKRWTKPVSNEEFQAFIGIVLHLGLIKFTGRRQKLWENTKKGNAFVRSIMSQNRFETILKAWHYVNYGEYSADEIKEKKAADPFWPVSDMEKDLNERFQFMMNPGQFVDIDEQCIPWKGRHKCRCYNKSKPVKRHFKVFSLNDSRNGFQLGFYIYRGIAEERPDDVAATAYPAKRLLAREKYHHKNHILVTDNWFTSFMQLTYCILYGVHMIGTFLSNRKGVPFSFQPGHNVRQTRERGDYKTMKSAFFATEELNEEVYYTSWLDRKAVSILHTIPTRLGTCSRMVKTRDLGWQRKVYTRPTVIPIYNYGMGGTDSGDQKMEAYRPELKTISWVPRVQSHFLNSVVVNCFIFYSAAFVHLHDCKYTHYEFRDK